jgi:hypothetical protein
MEFPECESFGVPVDYIAESGKRGDDEIAMLYVAGVPASYVHALRFYPALVIRHYWDRGLRIEDVKAYGIWAGEYDGVISLHLAGVPVSFALPLLEAGFKTDDVIGYHRDGVSLEYVLAASG